MFPAWCWPNSDRSCAACWSSSPSRPRTRPGTLCVYFARSDRPLVFPAPACSPRCLLFRSISKTLEGQLASSLTCCGKATPKGTRQPSLLSTYQLSLWMCESCRLSKTAASIQGCRCILHLLLSNGLDCIYNDAAQRDHRIFTPVRCVVQWNVYQSAHNFLLGRTFPLLTSLIRKLPVL